MHKYTYQDWVEGKVISNQLIDLFHDDKLSHEDLIRIENEQKYAHRLKFELELQQKIHFFIELYENSYAKAQCLQESIDYEREVIENFKIEFPDTFREAMIGLDGRTEMTYKEVNQVFNDSESSMVYHGNSHLQILLNLEYLQWLIWFQKREESNLEKQYEKFFLTVKGNPEKYKEREKAKSYLWQSKTDTELPELYQLLKDNQLIHLKTTFKQFKAVFTGQPTITIQPIIWIGATNLLAYFLDQAHRKHKKLPTNTKVWSLAKGCFTGSTSLIQSRTNYENSKSGKPTNFEIIDTILVAL
jgi:hypothetical protein